MINNFKTKKRLTQVIVAFVVLCMSVTGSFLLLEDSIGTVNAEDRNVSTKAQWDSVMAEAASQGGTWNIALDGNIELTGVTGYKLAAVPSNATVILNMNNCNITWDYSQNGGDWNSSLMSDYSNGSTYRNGEYWGLIENNGTLNIIGDGTIRNKKIHITTQRTDRDNSIQRLATIVNNGALTVGGGIKIESYLTHVHNSEKNSGGDASYSDNYLYNFGIYSSGGSVSSAANISVGGLAGTSQNGTSGRAYNLCYGIYADGNTKLNVTGGNIYVDSFSGGFMETGSADKAHMYASSVGVFGNNAFVTGNTTINVLSKNWEYQDQNSNTWKNGIDHLLAVGIMYKGSSYPVLGPSVDVVASFEHIGDNKTQVYVPGAGDAAYSWSDVFSDGDAGNISHVASAVAGVSGTNNNIGTHTSETDYGAKFFGGTTPWESIGNGVDANRQYKTLQSHYSGANTTVVAPKTDNGDNSSTRMTAAIVNGAPGNTGSGGLTSANSGNPGSHSPAASGFKTGSQYLVVYRYYSDVTKASGMDAVSVRWDKPEPARVKNQAVVSVGSNSRTNGILSSGEFLKYTSGGESAYDRYYDFVGRTYEIALSADSTLKNKLDDINPETGVAKTPGLWYGSKGILDGVNGAEAKTDKDNVLIVYMDYQIKDPTAIRVAVAGKNTAINQYSQSASKDTLIEVPYTGGAIVPGKDENADFRIGILDMGADTSLDTNDTSDDTVITDVYDVSGNGSGSGNNATAVTYEYSSDGTTWDSGLPTNVGDYTVRVNVNGDTIIKAGSYNRAPRSQVFKLRIKPAEVKIVGNTSKTVTYGLTYGEIFDFNEYTATNKYNDAISGSWSLAGAALSDVPNAGSYESLRLVWTPDASSGSNYGRTEVALTLVVNKRTVNVSAADATVVYGDATPKYDVIYGIDDLGGDADKAAGWLASTVFEIKHNGEWKEYYQGMPAGTYNIRIKTFGGAEDPNNIFKTQETGATIKIDKRAIKYTAVADSRVYNGSDIIDVVLKNPSNNYAPDVFDSIINGVDGKMDNADAGIGKLVKIDTENVNIQHKENYYLVIDNADTLKVDIAQAVPTGVSVVASPATIVYNKTNTLGNTVSFDATVNPSIPGTWTWENENVVPSVNVTTYTAKFTPDNKNYTTITQPVTLVVDKAPVEVTIDAVEVIYGKSVTGLNEKVKYNGFTGDDSLANIKYEGNTVVDTTYTPGSGVGTYTISVTTDITTENYYFISKNGTVTVKPAPLTVTANDDSITYGDAEPKYNVDDVTVSGFYGSDTLNSIGAKVTVDSDYYPGTVTGKAGDHYKVNVSVETENKNYDITCVPGKLTVNKAKLTVTPKLKTVTYGADIPTYTVAGTDYLVTGFVNGDTLAKVTINGAPKFNTQYTSESFANNTYPVKVSTSEMTADNYIFTGVEGSIKVVQAKPSITTLPAATVVNSHSLADATFSNTAVIVNPNDSTKAVAGTFKFVDSSVVPAWGSSDEYKAVFTPEDAHNYSTVEVDIVVTVTVKNISGTPIIQGSAMVGALLKVNVDSMDPASLVNYKFQWYVGNAAVSGATASEYTVKDTDLNKEVYVVLTAIEADGFKGTATSIKTSAVIDALEPTDLSMFKAEFPGVLNTESGVFELEYDANTHEVNVTVKDEYASQSHVFGKITVNYNGKTAKPEAAGSYIVTIDVGVPSSKTGTNYDDGYIYHAPVSGLKIGDIKINPAPLYLDIDANDKIYDGTVTATANIPQPSGFKDTMDEVYVNDDIRFTFDNKNVGENKTVTASNIIVTGKDAPNYKIIVNPITASITPKTLEVSAYGVKKSYDGSNIVSVSFEVNANTYAPVDSAATIYLINGIGEAVDANAGEGIRVENIDFDKAGSSKDNYEIKIVNNPSVIIEQAKPTVAPIVISQINGNAIVYDAGRNLGSINPDDYHSQEGSFKFDDETIVPTVKQKTYAATYTPDNRNYYAVPVEITIVVVPKEVTITVDNKSVVYGSNAPAYTVTPTGFFPGDSLADVGGTYKINCSYYPGADVASYPITIDTRNMVSDNYSFVGVPGYLTVTRKALNVTATAENKVYDKNTNVKVSFSEPAGVFGSDDVDLSEYSVTGFTATANAGTTTVSYLYPSLVGSKAGNYELNISPKSNELTVEIAKADVSGVKFPSGAQVEFGYDLTYVTFENEGEGDGTFAYENAKLVVPGELKVYDTYKVIFTPTDARNYNTQEAYVSLQVIKCTLDYVVGVAGNPQVNQTLAAVTTGLPATAGNYVQYQWFRVKNNEATPISGATNRTYVATEADVGYTLIVMTSFDVNDPYVYSENANVETIGELSGIVGKSADAIKEVTLTFWQRLMNWLYRIIAVLTGVQLNGGLF